MITAAYRAQVDFENEGFTNEIWEGVKIGLISHYKPISELLSPILKDQKSAFDNQFAGMTAVEFSYNDYETTRALLIQTIGERLTSEDKQFLLILKAENRIGNYSQSQY